MFCNDCMVSSARLVFCKKCAIINKNLNLTIWWIKHYLVVLLHNGVLEYRPFTVANRELKKLRRLLQRKRHIKIELSARLSVLRLLHVGNVVRTR